MHDAIVKMKDGTNHVGPLWTWRPQYGWFSLVDGLPIALDDVESLRIDEERLGPLGDVTLYDDGLARAVDEGWEPGECSDGNLLLLLSWKIAGIEYRRQIERLRGLREEEFLALPTPTIGRTGYLAREDWDKPWEPGEPCHYRGPLDSGFHCCRFHRDDGRWLHLWIDHRVEAKPEEIGAFGMR